MGGTPLSTLPCAVEGLGLVLVFLGIAIPVGTWAEYRNNAGIRSFPNKRWQRGARTSALFGSFFGYISLSILGLGPKTSPCPLASVWAQKMCVLQLQGKRRTLGLREEAWSLYPCV